MAKTQVLSCSGLYVAVSNWSNPGFKVLPDVKLLLTHDCGGRVMLLRSSIFHKLQQLQQQLFLKEEHTHSGFLLRATIPRSAASAAKGKVPKGCFRLLLHHSPLTHKHLVFVPAQCLNENHYKHRHPKTGLVSLVTGKIETEVSSHRSISDDVCDVCFPCPFLLWWSAGLPWVEKP